MQEFNYKIRELEMKDFKNGLLECFKELTIVGDITDENFKERFNKRKRMGIVTVVAVENETNKILGTGSVFYEPKFIRSCSTKGFIEDICVAKYAQKKGVGKELVKYLRNRALSDGCYKILLTCNENNELFYEKMDFKKIEIAMAIYSDD